MINKIFVFIFLIGLVYAFISGREDIVITEMLNAPKEAFMLFIDIYVLLIFWGGLLQICQDTGLLKIISKGIVFIIKPLFKNIDKDDEALQFISMNYLANMLSLGSAATPFGLKAMDRLSKLNNYSETASNEMITFLVLNTSGICLIPTILISIRNQFGSSNPVEVVPYILIVSSITTISAILLDAGGRKFAKY